MILRALSSFLQTTSTGGFNYKWSINATKFISIERRKLHMISTALSSFLQTNSTGGFNYKWSKRFKLISIEKRKLHVISTALSSFDEQILREASTTNEI